MKLDDIKMSEAEVSLRLSMYLLDQNKVNTDIRVALDGAQIKTGENIYFPIWEFLDEYGFEKTSDEKSWQGEYKYAKHDCKIIIHSTSGVGDVTTTLNDGSKLVIESKKGTLEKSKSSQEYKLIREALGQLFTLENYDDGMLLGVAIPDSDKARELANRWSVAPLISKNRLGFYLVSRDGSVHSVFCESV